jgi:tetratricopeptide (TPR) repeat protein
VGKGGGGDTFLDFIELELIPHINKTYRTHDFKIVTGSSIGGLLVLHSLQSRPHLFQAHMAYSPAVWWGDTSTAKKTKEFIANTKTLTNYLYMNIGEEGGDMRGVYDDLLSFIQQNKPAKFKLKSDVFADIAHGLTAPAGIFNAYHNLFLPLRMPNSELNDGTKSILDYYTKLSWQRGETIKPMEWVIRELCYYLVNENDLPAAIELFKFGIELYPESAAAYNGLAYGFEKNEQFSNALIQVNLALKFAKEDDDGYDIFIKRRDRLRPLVK